MLRRGLQGLFLCSLFLLTSGLPLPAGRVEQSPELDSCALAGLREDKQHHLWINPPAGGIFEFDGQRWWRYTLPGYKGYEGLWLDSTGRPWTYVWEQNLFPWSRTGPDDSPEKKIFYLSKIEGQKLIPVFATLDVDQMILRMKADYQLPEYAVPSYSDLVFDSRNEPRFSLPFANPLLDHQGHIWSGSSRPPLSLRRQDPGQNPRFFSGIGPAEPLLADRQGRIWAIGLSEDDNSASLAGKGSGFYRLFRIEPNGTWQAYGPETLPLHTGFRQRILQDAIGRIWLATKQGLYIFDGQKWYRVGLGLSQNQEFHSLALDYRGQLWIGSNGTIGRISGNQVSVWTFDSGNSGTPDIVADIFVDAADTKWLRVSQPYFSEDNSCLPALQYHEKAGFFELWPGQKALSRQYPVRQGQIRLTPLP